MTKLTLSLWILFIVVEPVEAQPVVHSPTQTDTVLQTRRTLRPLTLPQGTLAVGGRLGFHRSIENRSPYAYARLPVDIEIALGIVDAFEVTITPVRYLHYTFAGAWQGQWFDPSIRLATSFELASAWQLGGAFTGTLPLADDAIDFFGSLELNTLYRSRHVSVLMRVYGSVFWYYGRSSLPENDFVAGLSVAARAQLTPALSMGVTVEPSLRVRSGVGSETNGELILGGFFAFTIPRAEGQTPWADLQLALSGPAYQSDEFSIPEIRMDLTARFYVDLF